MSFFLIQKAGYLLGDENWETWWKGKYYDWWFYTGCRNSSIRDCEYLNKHDPIRIRRSLFPQNKELTLEIRCGRYNLAPLIKSIENS